MFGYVRVLESELKVREYALYKSVYCGLCKTMGKRTRRSSSLALSYDFTFLAFFRAAMSDEGFELYKTRCLLHPFKKRAIARENASLRYCAGASAVLGYYKLLDDLCDRDKKGFARLAVRLMLPIAKRQLRSAVRALPEYDLEALSSEVKAQLDALSALEGSASPSPDACADAFGTVLATVFSHALEHSDKKDIAHNVGYHMGKWIYLADAADDLAADASTASFNPLLAAGYTSLPADLLSDYLTVEAGTIYDELTGYSFRYSDIKDIIINTVSLGMPAEAKRIFTSAAEDPDRLKKG